MAWNFWTPLSETLYEIISWKNENKNLIILETSSFMLYNLNNFNFDYSIITNLWVDHLDWHKDLQEYFDSKFNIVDFTKNYAIMDKDNINLYKKNRTTKAEIEEFQQDFDLNKTNFLWKHNEWNWNASLKIIKKYFEKNNLKWNEEIFWEVAKNIEPLDHRIKMVKEFWWIKIYDDWICTSSQALNVALNSFNEKITLIAGGYDKWDDYTWLANELEKKVWFACLIWQTAKKFEVILKEKNIDYQIFESLREAVHYAISKAKNLWIKNILFSPWSASFDMFENVYDRCDQFLKIIDIL